jgi:hypothetical protein
MLEDGACVCGSKHFHPGPRGGAAHNVMCAMCGSKFWYCPPFPSELIDNEDKVYSRSLCMTLDEIMQSRSSER